MAQVVDLWHKKDRSRSGRYGIGKRWQAIYHDAVGQRYKESFATKDEAEAFLADQVIAVGSGRLATKAQRTVTFGDLWPRFEAIKSNKSKKTQEMYSGVWNLYVKDKWGSTMLRDVRSPAVDEWLAGLKSFRNEKVGISESYEHKILLVLKSLCQLAVADGALPKSPLAESKARSQPATSRRYLEVSQTDALLESIKPHDLMVEVMLHTLVRRGEAAGFKVSDLSVSRKRLRVERDIDEDGEEDGTKNRRHRDVPVGGPLLERLKEAVKDKAPGDYIMTGPGGKPWTKHTWRVVWEKARTATGIYDLDTHELRHTGVSWAIHAGANIKTIQRMCGHASAAMTLDIYGHLWDDQLDLVSAQVYTYVAAERKRVKDESKKEKSASTGVEKVTAHELPTAKPESV